MRILNPQIIFNKSIMKSNVLTGIIILFTVIPAFPQVKTNETGNVNRERISLNEDWRFYKYDSGSEADNLIYDIRPEEKSDQDDQADAQHTEVAEAKENQVLKPWILPSGNKFIEDPVKHYVRPEGSPGSNFPFVLNDFDDSLWEKIDLPHDWAIKGPFMQGWDVEVGGSMGRLPSPGVAWYRKKIDIPSSDAGKSIFLEVDGAMSYAMVWLNGNLVGGWPYGYNSWQLDLTKYIVPGGDNQLAFRLDNPPNSSRWYPGGGIYRNMWLTKTNPVHVGQWGTFITTRDISDASATIDMGVAIDNDSGNDISVKAGTKIFVLDKEGKKTGNAVSTLDMPETQIAAGKSTKIKGSITLDNPILWGPPPTQTPNLYVAVTTLFVKGEAVDQYETRFGIRSLRFDPNSGIYVNDELIKIKGVNLHHDLGALGAAFNTRAAKRQLEMLRELGCNAIRTAHNPPAPELLELTDKMGFLVIDETFDAWESKKTPLDFHLIFPEWHEQDLRAMIRRDRNCPSVIIWSYGNEVGEQYTDAEGAAVGKLLVDIIKEEDTTRPTICAMNWAKPDMPFPAVMDVIGLNYQGEGIRQDPMFEGVNRIRTEPMYKPYHEKFPGKVVLSTETSYAVSSRGIYLFPVTDKISSPVRDSMGGDSKLQQVSSYELYAVDYGSSVDKVFDAIDRHPFVAGEFVWTGWAYLGEPEPYYECRSSYSGMFDLAGFKRDRFYLYQAHWRPEFPMAHILPHWNWPEREGEITPVHVFTSGNEAELFLNGKSLGRKKKGNYEYRLRWNEVKYKPGELKVVAYKDGKKWAEDVVVTTNEPVRLEALTDRETIYADGKDLSFVTVKVTDKNGLTVPDANNQITFSIEGPGEIVATDNGDPCDFTPFPAHERKAYSGMALVIIRSKAGKPGSVVITAQSPGLRETQVVIKCQ